MLKFDSLSLDARLLSAVKAAGYVTPTPIQQQAIPAVLAGHDVLGLAQTGTGKTAAFMLPILNRLLTGKMGVVRALIIAPTRELAEQIHQATVVFARGTKIRSTAIYGGVSKRLQAATLRRGVEIVVACPGRLLDHVGDRAIDLTNVEVLVLDEADHMFDMGFLPDVRRILSLVGNRQQTLMFSATMPYEIRGLAESALKNPVEVSVSAGAPAKTVSHALYPVPEGLKSLMLMSMLNQVERGRTLIFTRTKRRARSVAEMLEGKGYNVAALQGNMAQNQRQKAINGFRSGEYDVLVATDIAARGIDVTGISHVINYDMPDTVDAYTHRIGRTGRAQAEGEAFTFMVPTDIVMVRDIEKVLGMPIERRRLPSFDYGSFTPEHLATPAIPAGGRPSVGGRRGGRSLPQVRKPLPETAGGPSAGGHAANSHMHGGQPANQPHGQASAQASRAGSWGRPSSRRYTANQARHQG